MDKIIELSRKVANTMLLLAAAFCLFLIPALILIYISA